MAGSNSSSTNLKLQYAARSYGEVLDATKHQDDKIGRFLTAIAFLFTGAIAFATRTDVLQATVNFGHRTVALPAILLGLFLVLSVMSVLLLVVALGPNLKLPRPERDQNRDPSPLFFLSIAGRTRKEWHDQWDAVSEDILAKAYVDETLNLATKTDFKFSRTNEARGIFTLALLFLALTVVLWFEAVAGESVELTPGQLAAVPPLEWTLEVRLLVALVISSFAFVLAYDFLRLDQEIDYFVKLAEVRNRMLPLYALTGLAPAYICALVIPASGLALTVSRWVAFLSAIGIGFSLGRRARLGQTNRLRTQWERSSWLVGAVLAGAGWWGAGRWSAEVRICLAIGTVVLLELPRLFNAAYWWYHRRARVTDRRNWRRGDHRSPSVLPALWTAKEDAAADADVTELD